MEGGALSHIDASGDTDMRGGGGWAPEYVDWWFEFLNEKGGKGVSKDTWVMVSSFFRFPSLATSYIAFLSLPSPAYLRTYPRLARSLSPSRLLPVSSLSDPLALPSFLFLLLPSLSYSPPS